MAFCSSCGSQVEGRFCPKCGAPQAAAGGGATGGSTGPQPGYTPPAQPAAGGGMDDNLAGALCYLLGLITGVIFLVMEPYSKRPFVRYHAFQSILFSAAWIVFSIAVSIFLTILSATMHMWLIFMPLRALIGLLGFGLWLYCMFKAYNREMFQLPIVGPIAAKQAAS